MIYGVCGWGDPRNQSLAKDTALPIRPRQSARDDNGWMTIICMALRYNGLLALQYTWKSESLLAIAGATFFFYVHPSIAMGTVHAASAASLAVGLVEADQAGSLDKSALVNQTDAP